MRTVVSLSVLTLAFTGLFGCDSGAPFNSINSVSVRHIGPAGLVDKKLTEEQVAAVTDCLYTSKEVPEAETRRDLLSTTYLIQVADSAGDRSFELYTKDNIKGNKGKYYYNACIFELVK